MLKLLKKLLIFSGVSLCVISVVLHIFLNRDGKQLVQAKLVQTFNKPVTVGSVHTRFPLDLVVKDISVGDIGTAEYAVAQGGLLDVLNGNFVLKELSITGAKINLVKEKGDEVVQASPAPDTAGKSVAVSLVNLIPRITLKKLSFRKSVIDFKDLSAGENGISIRMQDVNADFENISLPIAPGTTNFSLSGILPWEDGRESGQAKLKGWIDLQKKDMQASLSLKNIDGLFFYPYFSGWIDTEKAKISQAKLNFESQITGKNNDVTMNCHMELTEVEVKSPQEGEEQGREEKMANLMIGLLKSMNQGKIALDFKIITKMDSPKFGFGVIKRTLDAKIDQCVQAQTAKYSPVNLIAGAVGETLTVAGNLTRAAVDGTVGIGKVIYSTFTAPFNRRERKILDQADRLADEPDR